MHPHAAARARLAAMEVVRSLGLEADEIVDLQDSNRLTVRVLPCDLVARIGPADHAGAQVEVDRVLRLAEAEAPVGRLDPRTPPQVHVRDGFEITLWTHYAPHEDRALPAAEYASTLARLHAAMRAADLDVSPVGDRVAEALALVDDPVCTPRL
ncbi:MAG: aminoglycoside phosphotransferase family protein, partial [Brachybacterium tyrofermentans]